MKNQKNVRKTQEKRQSTDTTQMLELAKVLKVAIIATLKDIKGNMLVMNEKTENISKEIKIIIKNQMEILELNNTITDIKSSMDGFTIGLEGTEEKMSELEDGVIELIQSEQKRENRWEGNEQSFRDMWVYNKSSNRSCHGISQGEKESGTENVLEEITAEIFSNLEKQHKPTYSRS